MEQDLRHLSIVLAIRKNTAMVESLSHLTFIVRDLDRMEAILCRIFEARKVYDSGSDTFSLSKERFFLVGKKGHEIWIAIMEGDPLPTQTYNHIAFKISDDDFDDYLERVRSAGMSVRQGRSRVDGEGRSVYFYDDDNHMFELHTGTLEERLRRYAAKQAVDYR